MNDIFLLDSNKLEITNIATGQCCSITFNQYRLLNCLINGREKKDEIIQSIWGEDRIVVSDGSYHQLIFQTRNTLKKAGLSNITIKTLPRYGLRLVDTSIKNNSEYYGDLDDEKSSFQSLQDISVKMWHDEKHIQVSNNKTSRMWLKLVSSFIILIMLLLYGVCFLIA